PSGRLISKLKQPGDNTASRYATSPAYAVNNAANRLKGIGQRRIRVIAKRGATALGDVVAAAAPAAKHPRRSADQRPGGDPARPGRFVARDYPGGPVRRDAGSHPHGRAVGRQPAADIER